MSHLLEMFHVLTVCVLLLVGVPLSSGFSAISQVRPLSVGIDIGTSGARSCIIDKESLEILSEEHILWEDMIKGASHSSPKCWQTAVFRLLWDIPADLRQNIERLCISGTSASVLMYDKATKQISRPPRMYNYNVITGLTCENAKAIGAKAMEKIEKVAPPEHPVRSGSSVLAKLLAWHFEDPIKDTELLFHQSDFLAYTMRGGFHKRNHDGSVVKPVTDWHNCLKLGFDVHELKYPVWLMNIMLHHGINAENVLPRAVEPGMDEGQICPSIAEKLGINKKCSIMAGTTDSIAAFYAAQVSEIGQAVTSLGSTLVVKLLSEKPAICASRGIYSHRLADGQWLVGGASNVGCAIFRKEGFKSEELDALSQEIDPHSEIDLDYYPLCSKGERFPINDPEKEPVLEPKPESRREYLHGILQALSKIECSGYRTMRELGASHVQEVHTAGGGAVNQIWAKMREKYIGVSVHAATNVEACFGVARLGTFKPVKEPLVDTVNMVEPKMMASQ